MHTARWLDLNLTLPYLNPTLPFAIPHPLLSLHPRPPPPPSPPPSSSLHARGWKVLVVPDHVWSLLAQGQLLSPGEAAAEGGQLAEEARACAAPTGGSSGAVAARRKEWLLAQLQYVMQVPAGSVPGSVPEEGVSKL